VWTDHVADNGVRSRQGLYDAPQRVVVVDAPPPELERPTETDTPGPPTEVTTFDPAGAVLAAQPAPKKQRPWTRWIMTSVVFFMLAVTIGFVGIMQYRQWNKDHEPSSVTKTTIDVEGGYVIRQVKLGAGQAARIRVEAGKKLQVDVWLLAKNDDAIHLAEVWASDYRNTVTDVVPDPDAAAIASEFFTDAEEVLPSGADTNGGFAGYTAVARICCQSEGRVVTGRYVSLARTTYRLAVVAKVGTGNVRIVVQNSDGPRLAPGDALSDVYADSGFFSDGLFFSDSGSYTPTS
jgi:hypothetical protein